MTVQNDLISSSNILNTENVEETQHVGTPNVNDWPGYGRMLHVESSLIATFVRTSHEACCLLEVSFAGQKLDLLMEKYLRLLERQKQVRDALHLAESVAIPLENAVMTTVARRDFSSSVPSLRRLNDNVEMQLRRVELVMESVLQQLKLMQSQLRQFADLNRATARELASCNLSDLVQQKLKVAQREIELAEAINKILS